MSALRGKLSWVKLTGPQGVAFGWCHPYQASLVTVRLVSNVSFKSMNPNDEDLGVKISDYFNFMRNYTVQPRSVADLK